MFWDNFVRLCYSIGKSPNAVASEIGLKSTGTVTGWKNGAIPRPSVIQKLASYFNVPVEYLTETEEPPSDMDRGNMDDFTYAAHKYSGKLTAADKATVIKMMATLASANQEEEANGQADGDLSGVDGK